MTVSIQMIKDLNIFKSLKPESQEDLAKVSFLKDYSVNTILQMQDEPCENVGFVLSGSAVIFRLAPNGDEQIISVLTPGMHFNSVPALEARDNVRASIKAISPLTILVIPVNNFRNLLQSNADIAFIILKDFAKRLDHLVQLVDELSLHSVRGRLASFLLNQALDNDYSKVWTQDEIAAHLGTVRDVIGRTLRSFIKAGFIERKSGRIILLDHKGLQEEANS